MVFKGIIRPHPSHSGIYGGVPTNALGDALQHRQALLKAAEMLLSAPVQQPGQTTQPKPEAPKEK